MASVEHRPKNGLPYPSRGISAGSTAKGRPEPLRIGRAVRIGRPSRQRAPGATRLRNLTRNVPGEQGCTMPTTVRTRVPCRIAWPAHARGLMGYTRTTSTSRSSTSTGHSRFCLQRRIESTAAPNCPRASWSIRILDCAGQRAKLLPRLHEPRVGWLLRLEPRDLHPKSEDHQSPSGALPRLIVGNRTPLPVVPLYRLSTPVVRER